MSTILDDPIDNQLLRCKTAGFDAVTSKGLKCDANGDAQKVISGDIISAIS